MKLSAKTQEARLAILRDVVRSGGVDNWSHLHSHGHHFTSVKACISRGDLTRIRAYHYAITEAGRLALKSEDNPS